MEEVLKTFAPAADEKGLELLCDIAPDVPELVAGDPGRLRQILLNLLSNAIKFTAHGEVALKVEVDAEDRDTRVVKFTVTDTGIGVPAEKQVSIFSPFTQADSSTTREYGGTGLGLTISSRLVAMMGGRIWLESEVGRGTQFHFTTQLQVGGKGAGSEVMVPLETLNGLRILVVDDNKTNRRILQGMLTRWAAQTTCSRERRAGLVRIGSGMQRRQPYQLVLTDMHMPDMDGFGLVEQIRRNPELIAGDRRHAHLSRSSGGCGALPQVRHSIVSLQTSPEAGVAGSDFDCARACPDCLSSLGRSTGWAAAGT